MRKLTITILLTLLVLSVGCQSKSAAPEKSTSLQVWPVYDNRDSVKVTDDYWTRSEHGNALFLISWDNCLKYDPQNNLMSKNTLTKVWPVYRVNITEDAESITSRGKILFIFNFDETKAK
jgi:thioredoxin-related protein